MEEAAKHGKASNVNMTVRDIYGESYLGIGLTADMPAGAFGKTAMYADTPAGQQHTRPELSDFNMTCVLLLLSLYALFPSLSIMFQRTGCCSVCS